MFKLKRLVAFCLLLTVVVPVRADIDAELKLDYTNERALVSDVSGDTVNMNMSAIWALANVNLATIGGFYFDAGVGAVRADFDYNSSALELSNDYDLGYEIAMGYDFLKSEKNDLVLSASFRQAQLSADKFSDNINDVYGLDEANDIDLREGSIELTFTRHFQVGKGVLSPSVGLRYSDLHADFERGWTTDGAETLSAEENLGGSLGLAYRHRADSKLRSEFTVRFGDELAGSFALRHTF